jgi:Ca-activated chloride channel family protein
VASALVLVATASLAWAQDLDERRGFSVTIVEPASEGLVGGETDVVAEVRAPDPADVERVEFFVNDELVFVDAEPPYRLRYDFGTSAEVYVIRVEAHHRVGVSVSDFVVTRGLGPTYFVDVQRIVMDVSVRDDDKRLVPGLSAEAFSVEENGRPARIVEVSPEERPIHVGILIDSSGSMVERIEAAQLGACGFVETLRDEDAGFVVDFDEAVYLIQTTTSDRDRLCRSLRSTEAVGGTALYDAIHASYRVLEDSAFERRALVVLTDGTDTESSLSFEEIRAEARRTEVTIYAIGLAVGMTGAKKELNDLTGDTGGRAFFVKKADELAETYRQIGEELRSLYQVVYASDHEWEEGRFVEVDVEVRDEDGRKLDARHRRGYYATGDSP